MSKGFPVNNTNILSENVDFYKNSVYSTSYMGFASNGTGFNSVFSSGTTVSGVNSYRTATPFSFTANTYERVAVMLPIPGKALVFRGFEVNTDAPLNIMIQIRTDLINGVDNDSSDNDFLINTYRSLYYRVNANEPKTVKFFDDIILRYGVRADIFLFSETTADVRYLINTTCYEITNDFNYSAPKKFGVIGDSICFITNERGAPQDDLWGFRFKKLLNQQKKSYSIVNMGIGGSNSIQWDVRTRNGYIDGLNLDALFINIGMNDCVLSRLQTTLGVDGQFKLAMRNTITKASETYPNAVLVVVGVTDTIEASRNVVITSGVHNGLTLLEAVNVEQEDLVNELALANVNVHFSSMSGLWDENDNSYYVSGDASTDVHPNSKAQKLMGNKLFTDLNTIF